MKETSKTIQYRLTKLGIEKARWLENYVKHNVQSKGVGIPKIREVVKAVVREYELTGIPSKHSQWRSSKEKNASAKPA